MTRAGSKRFSKTSITGVFFNSKCLRERISHGGTKTRRKGRAVTKREQLCCDPQQVTAVVVCCVGMEIDEVTIKVPTEAYVEKVYHCHPELSLSI